MPDHPFAFSNTNKRYHTLDYHLKQTFGEKAAKISLNAGFTCPNIDGSKGNGGCTYCSSSGSGDFAGSPLLPLGEQFEEGVRLLSGKWQAKKYIAYFQAHTNTYAPLQVLREKFEEVLSFPGVVGISIATRADCISPEIADYLADLNSRVYLTVELGLQSIFDSTGARINRCHSYEEFLSGMEMLLYRGIRVCVHLINGLPGETREMMLESVRTISQYPIYGVKLHLLHVLRGTVLAEQYLAGEFSLLEKNEYVSLICDQLELLPPSVVIERITGDGDREKLIGPLWSRDKRSVLNAIDQELYRRNSMQGIRYPVCQ